MKPIEVVAPLGTVVNAAHPASVAGGNVETSQRIVDVLLGSVAVVLSRLGVEAPAELVEALLGARVRDDAVDAGERGTQALHLALRLPTGPDDAERAGAWTR